MKNKMSPVDVRELLGISRSAIRYYTEKGLITAKKNEQNGYSYYSGADLLELIDVAFFRNCLDANADEIHDITYAPSLEEYLERYTHQNDLFEAEIQRRIASLEMLRNFELQIQNALPSLNRFRTITLENPVYLFYPETGQHMNIRNILFSVSYWVSKFRLENGAAIYEESPMMVGESFVHFLDEEFPDVRYKKITHQRCLNVSFVSEKDLEDPALPEIVMALAQEQNVTLGDEIYFRYLLTFRRDGMRCHYYEAYIPFTGSSES